MNDYVKQTKKQGAEDWDQTCDKTKGKSNTLKIETLSRSIKNAASSLPPLVWEHSLLKSDTQAGEISLSEKLIKSEKKACRY